MIQHPHSNLTTYVPALRLYARVLCGNAGTGDGLVAWSLHRADELACRDAAQRCRFTWLLSTLRDLHRSGMLDRASNMPCANDLPGHEDLALLMTLPPAEREALTLVRFMGCTRVNAARIMGVSRSKVDRLLAMARLRLDGPPMGSA
ncbi:DUF134 domain-containing protein (plasmid) [Paracoccus liaowanqingii]|uniref:DUF134 domain-containing protein n=1 Tax=Paracoccus liaowanqingii TaxID=2560053 RepID=A0A4Y5SV81_9RHOB|nr:sigma factor-like helix-turn-helix DNA-binding protein [Paracoccus liaowanqingii]QDA36686.1 DUF134 domain-containing protein [Paracoccus liaowanqingii]